jgi:hypothetical protein
VPYRVPQDDGHKAAVVMAKRAMPAAFRANAARMKAGKPLVKKGGKTATPKNASKRRKTSK